MTNVSYLALKFGLRDADCMAVSSKFCRYKLVSTEDKGKPMLPIRLFIELSSKLKYVDIK